MDALTTDQESLLRNVLLGLLPQVGPRCVRDLCYIIRWQNMRIAEQADEIAQMSQALEPWPGEHASIDLGEEDDL